MKAVIGTTFKVQCVRPALVSPAAIRPLSQIIPKRPANQNKTRRKGTQLYRAVTSDGPFLLETPVCAKVGLALALNVKQAAHSGLLSAGALLPRHT